MNTKTLTMILHAILLVLFCLSFYSCKQGCEGDPLLVRCSGSIELEFTQEGDAAFQTANYTCEGQNVPIALPASEGHGWTKKGTTYTFDGSCNGQVTATATGKAPNGTLKIVCDGNEVLCSGQIS